MEKAKKTIPKKPKKKSKYDITVKSDLTADQLLKMAVDTPTKNTKTLKK